MAEDWVLTTFAAVIREGPLGPEIPLKYGGTAVPVATFASLFQAAAEEPDKYQALKAIDKSGQLGYSRDLDEWHSLGII